jgi:hypothetical protein
MNPKNNRKGFSFVGTGRFVDIEHMSGMSQRVIRHIPQDVLGGAVLDLQPERYHRATYHFDFEIHGGGFSKFLLEAFWVW